MTEGNGKSSAFYREHAEEARGLALKMTNLEKRAIMLDIAAHWDRLAEKAREHEIAEGPAPALGLSDSPRLATNVDAEGD
jgi:hypothetical protein